MISIIVPVFNEADNIPRLIKSLNEQDASWELIFVDGGSTDGSRAMIAQAGYKCLISSVKNRAAQLNLGAKHANGEILLFLHADSRFKDKVFSAIVTQLAIPGVIAGTFIMKLEPPGPFYGIYEWFTRINSIFFTYGDTGLFMKKEVFESLGGYADLPIMEDVEIQKRLRKQGRFIKIHAPVYTSSRRFKDKGSITQILLDIYIIIAWHLGRDAAKLKALYPDDKR